MTASQSLVSLCKAGVKRNGRWLVRNINLDIMRGEIITLIGSNGSGKTSTAKMVLGILSPTEGKIKQDPNIKIGYVPQKLNIDHALPLSVARMMELTEPIGHDAAGQALAEVGMLHMRNAEISTLSGGELQRILLARARARKPDLLVLDEPMQGIDFSAKDAFYCLISAYRDRLNCGILLISHDLHIVMPISDRVLCLNGHICYSGKLQDIATS
ncbi:MAG: zinc transport system ATP-binding protein [Candidatus Tokpelaia sp. JSC189]|nr:MAG: zinc transport system ATP-binding protein [Candidatus Tokpelaia sp. JSC189]